MSYCCKPQTPVYRSPYCYTTPLEPAHHPAAEYGYLSTTSSQSIAASAAIPFSTVVVASPNVVYDSTTFTFSVIASGLYSIRYNVPVSIVDTTSTSSQVAISVNGIINPYSVSGVSSSLQLSTVITNSNELLVRNPVNGVTRIQIVNANSALPLTLPASSTGSGDIPFAGNVIIEKIN